jgi:hypothetical protein
MQEVNLKPSRESGSMQLVEGQLVEIATSVRQLQFAGEGLKSPRYRFFVPGGGQMRGAVVDQETAVYVETRKVVN